MKINPVGDQVLIKVDLEETKSAGGLFLVSTEPVAKNTGVVEAIGDHEVVTVKIGDHVLFEKSLGRRFTIPVVRTNENNVTWTEEEQYILIAFFDVLAILED